MRLFGARTPPKRKRNSENGKWNKRMRAQRKEKWISTLLPHNHKTKKKFIVRKKRDHRRNFEANARRMFSIARKPHFLCAACSGLLQVIWPDIECCIWLQNVDRNRRDVFLYKARESFLLAIAPEKCESNIDNSGIATQEQSWFHCASLERTRDCDSQLIGFYRISKIFCLHECAKLVATRASIAFVTFFLFQETFGFATVVMNFIWNKWGTNDRTSVFLSINR